jgi:hypothetical protein
LNRNPETNAEDKKAMMRTKFLLLSAFVFLLLGWNTKDGVLFFFFAVHLFTLTIGVFLSKVDQKRFTAHTLDASSDSDPTAS